MLTGQGAKLADQGPDLLGSLLGAGTLSKLGSALGRFTGISEGAITRMLGMLFPVILSFLGKQKRSLGLGTSGLADLLTSQKDNIRAAMPPGLDNLLSSALPGISQFFGSARPARTDAGLRQPKADYQRATALGAARSPALRWAIPLAVACLAIIAILIWANRPRPNESVGTTSPVRETGAGSESSVTSFSKEATRMINSANGAFAQIKDATSADAAVPQLKEINAKLGSLQSILNDLPAGAKSSAKDSIRPLVERLKQAAQRVLGIPGIGDTVRPAVNSIISTLDALIG
jgi:hypothetical protein